MELRQLRYFVAVAEAGNIGAAARKLHVSQPPVTRQIRKLEQEIGGELFLRTPRGVELTPAGRAFLVEARAILAQTGRALSRGRAALAGEIGELDVGFMGSTIYQVIPRILRAFRARAPRVTIALHQVDKSRQLDQLRDGRLHVGFARFYPEEPDLHTVQVAVETPCLALSATSSLVDAPTPLAAVANEPLIVFPAAGRPNFADAVVALFRERGIEPHVAHVAETLPAALALTAAGLGVCVVPDSVAALAWPEVRFLAIDGSGPGIPVHCIYRAAHPPPVLATFLEALGDYRAARHEP